MKSNNEIAGKVGVIYAWLDEQLNQSKASGECGLCGKCCDFDSFGHKLVVTSPEMIYFAHKLGPKNIKKITNGRCSFQVEGSVLSTEMVSLSNHKCTVYPYRFSGCRIFSCKGDATFQSDLTETTIKKFKTLCDEFQIPYRYVDLPTALQNFTAANVV